MGANQITKERRNEINAMIREAEAADLALAGLNPHSLEAFDYLVNNPCPNSEALKVKLGAEWEALMAFHANQDALADCCE
jgi:hypothetical protein